MYSLAISLSGAVCPQSSFHRIECVYLVKRNTVVVCQPRSHHEGLCNKQSKWSNHHTQHTQTRTAKIHNAEPWFLFHLYTTLQSHRRRRHHDFHDCRHRCCNDYRMTLAIISLQLLCECGGCCCWFTKTFFLVVSNKNHIISMLFALCCTTNRAGIGNTRQCGNAKIRVFVYSAQKFTLELAPTIVQRGQRHTTSQVVKAKQYTN